MKELLQKLILLLILAVASIGLRAQTQHVTVEGGGTGPFPALVTGYPSLPGHSVYRPADLDGAASKGALPVVLFGNGGCNNNSEPFQNFLSELASHGYVIVAIGPFRHFLEDGNPWVEESSKTSDMMLALDWVFLQGEDPQSEFHGKIDLGNIAVMGQSCGGLQAIEASFDPRVTTSVILNSGVLNQPPPEEFAAFLPKAGKDDLRKLHAPSLYIIGDSSDIAYPNAMDDFRRIAHVPVAVANLNVGHGGTYQEAHGGKFTGAALAWLDWQLKGREEASAWFLGPDCTLCGKEGWRLETKNF